MVSLSDSTWSQDSCASGTVLPSSRPTGLSHYFLELMEFPRSGTFSLKGRKVPKYGKRGPCIGSTSNLSGNSKLLEQFLQNVLTCKMVSFYLTAFWCVLFSTHLSPFVLFFVSSNQCSVSSMRSPFLPPYIHLWGRTYGVCFCCASLFHLTCCPLLATDRKSVPFCCWVIFHCMYICHISFF